MKYWLKACALAVCTLSLAHAAHAGRESRPIQLDHRVRTVIYQPDEVFKFTGHYRYQSSIEFGKDEQIQTISMGDSTVDDEPIRQPLILEADRARRHHQHDADHQQTHLFV